MPCYNYRQTRVVVGFHCDVISCGVARQPAVAGKQREKNGSRRGPSPARVGVVTRLV